MAFINAGLSIVGKVLRTYFAFAIRAPVLPELTQASALPSLTRLIAKRIEEFFFFLNASTGDSSIDTT